MPAEEQNLFCQLIATVTVTNIRTLALQIFDFKVEPPDKTIEEIENELLILVLENFDNIVESL